MPSLLQKVVSSTLWENSVRLAIPAWTGNSRLGCWYVKGGDKNINSLVHSFVHSATKYLLNVCYLLRVYYWALFIGDAAANKTEKIPVLLEIIVTRWMPDVQGYFLLHNHILHVRCWKLLHSFSLHLSVKKSFSIPPPPSQMSMNVMVSYSKRQKKKPMKGFQNITITENV